MAVIDITWAQAAKDDYLYKLLCQAITQALSPWKPGRITLWLTDTNPDALVIETELLPRLPCAVDFSFGNRMLFHCDEAMAWSIADQAFDWFRYRKTPTIDDHIILGED